MRETDTSLIFVYNADSGVFNTMADIAHKMFSPSTYACQLCAITHGLLSEKQEWRAFIEQLGIDVEFLHRDEFEASYQQGQPDYPIVLMRTDQRIDTLIPTPQINACESIADLRDLIETKLHSRA